MMVGISFIVVGIILLIMGAFRVAKSKKYVANAAFVTGTVTGKERIRKSKSDSYRLTVHYTVDQTAYRKRLVCTHADYCNTSEGDPYELLYLEHDPEQAVRPGDIKPQTVRLLFILGIGFLLVGLALLVIGL